MGRNFQQSVLSWYNIIISNEDAVGIYKPLQEMHSLENDTSWGPTEWMYLMQGYPVTEAMRLAMAALCWNIAMQLRDGPVEHTLAWLAWWESLHHTRAEYSKRTGSDEYALITKFDFVPHHDKNEIDIWSDWFTSVAAYKINAGMGLDDLVPFIAYQPWLQAVAYSTPAAPNFIDAAIARTFEVPQPSVFYAQHQWAVWCVRNRHPNETYDTSSLMHKLFREHSLLQLACFWYHDEQHNATNFLPSDIPRIWQRPLFSGSDITDPEDSEWQHAWINVISTPRWACRLSFWVALIRAQRDKHEPPWLQCIVRDHPEEWKFFETMHSWMSQMPAYAEPTMTAKNMDTFLTDCIEYEYNFARALWTMYNSENTIDILLLPQFDD